MCDKNIHFNNYPINNTLVIMGFYLTFRHLLCVRVCVCVCVCVYACMCALCGYSGEGEKDKKQVINSHCVQPIHVADATNSNS